MFNFKATYERNNFVSFLSKDFLPEDFKFEEENLNLDFASKYATTAVRLGKCSSLDLEVFEITHKSTHDARVGISRDAFQLLLRKSYCNRALVAFIPEGSKNYRFSLLQIEAEQKEQSSRITRNYSNPRRYSYFLGEDAHTKTPEQFLREKGRIKSKDGDYFKDLLERFSVEVLTKQFYNELSNWYFWAIKNVSFPNDINDDSDDEKYNTENVIRLITRLIFTWFLKQKKLINPDLFDPVALSGILTNFKPESEKQTNYYRAVLQNLFFATLNQEIGKRGFAEDKGFLENKSTNGIKNLYRFEKEFSGDTKQIMQLFSQVPFLNGGLFECLDDKKKDGKTFYWDGFSRNPKRQANIPNSLFFAKEQIVDISKEYNNKKMQAVKVSGIIEILNRYNFTVEENTPVEIEVALDPELLGKVFENLLGAFNPETQETARKQTGSFYTPREIVSYMVNESLIAYFKTNVPELSEETIRSLFSYEEQLIEIAELEREAMIQAAFNCKILDPACGSGAFPMGILQQMVHILSKLDPCNTHWNKVVLAQAMKEFDNAEKQTNEEREELLAEIEGTFDRSVNYPDYARKLHLIENCIYGVDIQSIAVQISKLRFFISLICEQKRNEDPTENFGIRPLPNLETKFVAANTLIGIEKAEHDMELFEDDHIKKLIDNLQLIRHRQFLVTNAAQKKTLREKDEQLRHEIVNEVQRLYVKHADENLSKYKMQKKVAEKELEQLVAAPDDIRTSVSSDLFGTEKVETFNYSEKRRKELKANIKCLNDQIEIGSDYSRLNSVVRLAEQLTSWNPYDQNESSPFFDPEWMFGLSKENGHLNQSGYFDITIGNPPYHQLSKDLSAQDEYKLYLKNRFKTSGGRLNTFIFFTHIGVELSKNNGVISYIIPNTILTQDYYKDTRKYLLDNTLINRIVSYDHLPFENAIVENITFLCIKSQQDNYPIYHYLDNLQNIHCDHIKQKSDFYKTETFSFNFKSNDLTEKIAKETTSLGSICHINQAIALKGDKNLSLRNENKDLKYYRLLDGRNINRYSISWDGVYLDYDLNKIHSCKNKTIFLSDEKLFFRRVSAKLIFTYDNEQYFALNTIVVVNLIDKSNFNLKYLLAILNSKLIDYYYFNKHKSTKTVFSEIQARSVGELPIKHTCSQQLFIQIVDKILKERKIKSDINVDYYESQIDNLVYKLYDLTYNEVKVIDPEFRLNENEYENLQLD